MIHQRCQLFNPITFYEHVATQCRSRPFEHSLNIDVRRLEILRDSLMSIFLSAGHRHNHHGLHKGAAMVLPASAVLLCALCSLAWRSSRSSFRRPTSSHHPPGQEHGTGQRVSLTSKLLSSGVKTLLQQHWNGNCIEMGSLGWALWQSTTPRYLDIFAPHFCIIRFHKKTGVGGAMYRLNSRH